ncbi:MAG: toll/interleukin-1 receptor domain-containing protein [Steroidobacteraceae bacterium]
MAPQLQEPGATARRYAAFISYSHHDRRWARWLHRAIETYRVPAALQPAPGRDGRAAPLRPIFLDREELSSSADLGAAVRTALAGSDWLIVVCSPEAARSRWVNEEVRQFITLHGVARVLCCVVAGDPAAPAGDPSACFPSAVYSPTDVAGGAPEPLAADLRAGADERRLGLLKLIAGMLRLPLDRLRQRDQARRQRRLVAIAAASLLLSLSLATLAALAWRARTEAIAQRRVAEQQALTARRTVDFLKSLFTVSDPGEARGNSVTAREVLDRGAQQVASGLQDEPVVRAELTTTLGEVYASLGLLTDGERLLEQATRIGVQPAALQARQAVALGEVLYQRGDYDGARRWLDQATGLLAGAGDAPLSARAYDALGDVYHRGDDYARARASFEQARRLAGGPAPVEREIAARALQGMADADFYDGRMAEAQRGYQAALQDRLALSGEMHPRTAEILGGLGSVAYLQGDAAGAARQFEQALQIERRVYGAHHPELAGTLNNLARVQLERRELHAARRLLQESLDMRASQVVGTEDDLAFIYSNLALARMGLGELREAEPLFQRALDVAVASRHRLHGPILADLADLECRRGRYRAGLERIASAGPIIAARYPDEPWRAAHVDSVRAGCLTGLGRYAEARALVEASLPGVLRRWPADSLYGHDALERALRLGTLSGDAAARARYGALLANAAGAGARR